MSNNFIVEIRSPRRISHGFIAATAVVLLALGSLASILAISIACASYADSVVRREYRIQKRLNQKACDDARDLIWAKDRFFEGEMLLSEFGCLIEKR